MKQVLTALLVVPLVLGGVFALLRWVFGRRGSNFDLVASVVSQWLVAYMVWTLAGAVIEHYGLFAEGRRLVYTKWGFGLFAAIFGLWQYRLARAGETRQAARVFAWSQIGWLGLVLAERGTLG